MIGYLDFCVEVLARYSVHEGDRLLRVELSLSIEPLATSPNPARSKLDTLHLDVARPRESELPAVNRRSLSFCRYPRSRGGVAEINWPFPAINSPFAPRPMSNYRV